MKENRYGNSTIDNDTGSDAYKANQFTRDAASKRRTMLGSSVNSVNTTNECDNRSTIL